MRQSIRALSWTVTISMLLLLAFMVTAAYSVFQTVLMEQGIRFGGFQSDFSNNTFVLSVPITVNNTGYYDISSFKMTTTLKDLNGTTLITNSTIIEEIKKGKSETRLYNLSLSLADILSHMTYLLFNDTEFKIDFSVGFKYAYALDFQLALTNTSMPWGAPLYGLNLREVRLQTVNVTHLVMQIFLELENHSFFDINGNLHLEVYNQTGGYIGSGSGAITIPSHSAPSGPIEVTVEIKNISNFTGKGYVEIDFEIPMFDYTLKIGRVPYG